MKAFADYNPISVFFCIMGVASVGMFCMDPLLLFLSLTGAGALFFARNGKAGLRECAWYPLLFLIMAIGNPLFSHKGVTVLFVLNDNPITLESVVYGLAMGTMVVGTLWWFRSFSQIMTSDKLLYLFGAASPKLALILSMTMRYIPLFRAQAEKTNRAQKALGLYKEDNIPDRLKGGLRVFSVMVTWALENGVITADSMTARGYGVGKRSQFAIFRFRRSDAILLAVSLALTALTFTGMGMGAVGFGFYPGLQAVKTTPLGVLVYFAYGVLSLLPAILELSEAWRWKSLQSAI